MMLTKILSKMGLPILLKFVGNSLTGLDSDLAKKASTALDDLNTAIEEKKISLEEIKEANRHLEKMQSIELEMDDKTLQTIHETIRKEMQAEDKFVRFWRPAFGYCVSIAWLSSMLTICWSILSDSEHAADIIMAMVETTSLWGVALGVLGVSVVKRSQEKMEKKDTDVVSKVMNKII